MCVYTCTCVFSPPQDTFHVRAESSAKPGYATQTVVLILEEVVQDTEANITGRARRPTPLGLNLLINGTCIRVSQNASPEEALEWARLYRNGRVFSELFYNDWVC